MRRTCETERNLGIRRVVVISEWDTFHLSVFKVILGSYGLLISKWIVTRFWYGILWKNGSFYMAVDGLNTEKTVDRGVEQMNINKLARTWKNKKRYFTPATWPLGVKLNWMLYGMWLSTTSRVTRLMSLLFLLFSLTWALMGVKIPKPYP